MTGPINRQPAGLLSYLGIKNFGRNPDQLGETIVPTWDLAPLMLLDSAVYFEATGSSFNALGGLILLQVPDYQTWCIHNFSAQTDGLSAGETCTFGVAIFSPTSIAVNCGPVQSFSAGAGSTWFNGPIYLRGREGMGIWVNEVTTGTAIDLSWQYRYTVMQD